MNGICVDPSIKSLPLVHVHVDLDVVALCKGKQELMFLKAIS